MDIRWDYPVYTLPEEVVSGNTVAKAVRTALSREEALKVIAGDDPRPLLVLRECKVCNGTDEALLKSGIDNEKTYLLSIWFHCVKLPADVMEADHPFHNLFLEETPEHLFVSSIDGSNHKALQSQTSRTELWKNMGEVLAKEYQDDPEKSLRKITRVLDKLDGVDERFNLIATKRDELLEEDGPGSRKLAKLQAEIDELEAERTELLGEMSKLTAIELVDREKARAEARKGAESAKTQDSESAPAEDPAETRR